MKRRTFFMSKSYDKMSDIELLRLYRETEDPLAIGVLYSKYEKLSRIIASEVVEANRPDFLVNFNDLYAIGIHCFAIAIDNFKEGENESLKAFWKKIAENEMKNEAKEVKMLYKQVSRSQMLEEKAGTTSRPIYTYSFSDGLDGKEDILMEDIYKFLFDPINGIKEKDAQMFLEYLDVQRIDCLSEKYGYTRKTVSKKINTIRRKIIINVLGEKI